MKLFLGDSANAMTWNEFRARRLAGPVGSFLILAALLALFFAYRGEVMLLPAPRFSVAVRHLPYYAFCSFYRMLAAYVIALIFSIIYGMLAARGPAYERVMIPAIDIAQSVPVIGFFPAAIYFFVALSRGSRLGVEMAAIFLIFTSQAWNMALGVFESVKTIPVDSLEAMESFGVTGFLKFRRLLLPASVHKLVYNSILSWVAGWYFLIACEIITVGPANYRLPGLGSFLMESADRGRSGELVAGLLALLAIIVLMDIFLWQPLSGWAEKFRYEFAASAEPMRTFGMVDAIAGVEHGLLRSMRAAWRPFGRLLEGVRMLMPRLDPQTRVRWEQIQRAVGMMLLLGVLALIAYGVGAGLVALLRSLARPWPAEVRLIPEATLASLLRLIGAYVISLAWTLPCALLAADNPNFSRLLAPLAEIVGSMPATALFPLIILFVIKVTGGMNLASILLILTGMQWYLLFNLLAGVRQVPEDLKEAARSFGLSRVDTWRTLVIPALVPSLITGSITAWGGGWNALILSEYFVYHGHQYKVMGLGALLDEATYVTGNGVMILLSLLSMVLVVMLLNRLVWRRLYVYATERYRLDY